MDTVKLEELTWTEVESAIADGTRTAIVPVGSVEQHGPHLPLGTDTYIGEAVAERVAERLTDALVAPCIRPGVSGHHMEFPGTISIDADVLIDTLAGYAASLERHGFEYVVFLPSHGGNFAPVETAAPEIARERESLDVITLSDIQQYMELMNEGLKRGGIDYEEPVIHAGANETSIMLAVHEHLVRTERRDAGHEGAISVPALLSKGFRYFTESGVLGDARESSREAGEAILENVAETYAREVSEARAALA
jgi:creatinine amidohydrolase